MTERTCLRTCDWTRVRDAARRKQGRGAAEADAGVHDANSVLEDLDRIEVHLADLGAVLDQRGHPEQHLLQSRLVAAWRPAIAAQESRALHLVEHGGHVTVGERMEPESHVGDELDESSAAAVDDERPERGVLCDSDEHLDTSRYHGLDEEVGQVRAE